MWSDPSSTNMAYGNQWMNMNPAMYKNMTNEQVDWASLAQQWIKMKETPPTMPPGQQVRIPTSEHTLPSLHVLPQNPSNVAAAAATNKTFSDHNIASPVTRNNIEKPSAWNTWTWQQQQQWNWNWASSSTTQPTKAPIMDSVNPLRPPFITPPILSEPPPSFPMMTPNKPFLPNNYWAGPNTSVPPPTEPDQWSKLNMIPNVDDRTQDPSFMDAAKRKQLPAWIREGLEKMEREKRRKIEQEQSFSEPDYSSYTNENVTQEVPNSPNNFDHEAQMVDVDDIEPVSSDYINDTEPRKTEYVKNDPTPLIPRKTKAQIWEDTMLSLRKILTKLLMDVTNDMMLNIVKDVLKTTSQTGLGVYGSESGSSDESDGEQKIYGHRQLKPDSDEAIQERILKRQREFSYIEARILIELDQLEDREKLVRSKFDNSIKLSGDTNDNGSQVVENIQTKGRTEDEGSSQKMVKGHDKIKKELSNDLNIKNGQKKKKSKSKRSSSSYSSSSSSVSKKSDSTNYKNRNKKSDKIKSKSSNSKTKAEKKKRRSRSRNRSRSHSISKSSRSHSRYRSRSHSRHYDRRSPHNFRSRRSRSPVSRHSYSRKHKTKRNSSSSSNESKSKKQRYRR
ncbi:arginine/serine-rich protein PNISR-like isoform X2 [Myzus persicae]|uniref:arginine/serine-rich protein PNISR-like isoform X2 n=1 Tax=Myzus persicae TaxID=13164 RepID=UPI000B935B42|nr:arginine/serine-rich protein PNISR-like isoform X2 [Myzus persicae]